MDTPISTLPAGFAEALADIVGPQGLRGGEAVGLIHPGQHEDNLAAGLVVSPGSTDETARVVRACLQAGVPIVSHGGRTGLVGGGISRGGQIVLSTARMNRILRLDPVERVAVVEAGVTLEALQEAAAAHGLEPGIDIPARGSATIGGMISTNAGGLLAFRNGVMRHQVFGMEAVVADGTVLSDLTRVVKTSAGYDVKHLLIGAEGTLGVVTAASIKLYPKPAASATALFSMPDVSALLDTIRLALEPQAGELRAAEAMWNSYIRFTADEHGWSDPAVPLDAPLYLLLSLGGRDEDALKGAFEALFETVAERYPDITGLIASSSRQEAELWRLREDTEAVFRRYPGSPAFDVSLPQSEIAAYVARIEAELKAIDPQFEPYIFGHLADGNIHLLLNRAGPLDAGLVARVEDVLYRTLKASGGCFSAEHGIGAKRIDPLYATGDAGKLRLMETIKATLDPQGLFNPGKVLRGRIPS
ncbi:FAD-binding oxidoreductase [Aureimonas populi]|uniref:FAD-binding oxidoreductase n=1 Tax=Aureimonas populi TaxID=1701758 RepID=A0ABW5CNR5_9HYPH|nr:FAD-binding oxidoreductase [Aureimonas populi]